MIETWYKTPDSARVALLSERWLLFDVERACSWAPIDPRRYQPATEGVLSWLEQIRTAPVIRSAELPLRELVEWAWDGGWRIQRVLGSPFDRRHLRQALNPAVAHQHPATLRLSLVGPVSAGNNRRGNVLLVEGHGWRAHLLGVLASEDEIGHDPLGEVP